MLQFDGQRGDNDIEYTIIQIAALYWSDHSKETVKCNGEKCKMRARFTERANWLSRIDVGQAVPFFHVKRFIKLQLFFRSFPHLRAIHFIFLSLAIFIQLASRPGYASGI